MVRLIAIVVIASAVMFSGCAEGGTTKSDVFITDESASVVKIESDSRGWYWNINGEEIAGVFGINYQPVPDGEHINDYEDDYAELYSALLDEEDGGLGHAKILSDKGFTAIKVYQLRGSHRISVPSS
ncbi:MAG: hypothetical protein WBC40_03460 [Halobacteriota archaeon]